MKDTKHIYLDYNATTPALPQVVKAFAGALAEPANPSSIHYAGRKARKVVEEARTAVRQLANASETYDVIFTATGTEANNLALQGLQNVGTRIVSAVEHPSVLKAWKDAVVCPVDEKGIIRLDALRRLLENNGEKKVLVSVQLANNETGVVQPIKEIAQLVFKAGGYFHTDAAQAVGKLPVDIQDLNVDMLTISAHKFGGPLGAAALVVKKGINLQAVIRGGGQELGYRAGTENVPAIAGFGIAASLEKEHRRKIEEVKILRDYIESSLTSYAPETIVVGAGVERLPNTTNIIMAGMHNETQLIAFDLEGVAVSAGSACSSGKVEVSHVLRAMQIEPEIASCAIRVSLGPNTTREEVDAFIAAWKKIHAKAKKKQAA